MKTKNVLIAILIILLSQTAFGQVPKGQKLPRVQPAIDTIWVYWAANPSPLGEAGFMATSGSDTVFFKINNTGDLVLRDKVKGAIKLHEIADTAWVKSEIASELAAYTAIDTAALYDYIDSKADSSTIQSTLNDSIAAVRNTQTQINLRSARTDAENTFAYPQTILSSLTVSGRIYAGGGIDSINTETILAESNIIKLNDKETGTGVTSGFAGVSINRGSATDYFFGFDESKDAFVISESETSADSIQTKGQVVATRPNSTQMTGLGLPVFNSQKYWFETLPWLTVDTTEHTILQDGLPINESNALKVYSEDTLVAQVDTGTAVYVSTANSEINFGSKPFRISQATEPTISQGKLVIWHDTTSGLVWLLYNDAVLGNVKTELQ